MKQLGALLILLGALSFSGCTKTVYVDRPVKVKVPVKCVVNDVNCKLIGTDPEIVIKLTECILDLKQEVKRCQ